MKSLITALGYAKNLWPYYIVVSLTAVLSSLAVIAVPFVLKNATDLISQSLQSGRPDVVQVVILAATILALDLVSMLVRNIGGYYGDIMSAKLREQLSSRYFEHLLQLPQNYYDNELTGTIVNRLNRAIVELTGFINIFANNFSQMILTSVLSIAIMMHYSILLGFLVLVIHPVFLWLTSLTSKKWQAYQGKINTDIDRASGRFAEVVSQMRVVKSYVQEARELVVFGGHYARVVSNTRRQSRYWHGMDMLRVAVLSMTFFGVYALVFVQTVNGVYSIGDMVLLIGLINIVRMPIFSLSFVVDQFQKAITGSGDFVEAMSLLPDNSDGADARDLAVGAGKIVFDNVSFHYTKNQPVLRGVSFELKPGNKLALVGESGQGKSTIANLLMQLYRPVTGKILIDNQDISSVSQQSLRRNIAAVFQDPSLFSGTIEENIAFAVPHASQDEIMRAARAANAHDFIVKLPDGYKSVVGERGVKLSGGQKQRIAIARAILKDAQILILDEATSSLDSKAEQQVQEALDRLMRGKTTLIIAHRLSTIAHVDTIVTLRNGMVDEVGTPADLAKTGGIYAELLSLQMSSSDAAKKKLGAYEIGG